MERRRLKCNPTFHDSRFYGWTINFIKKNYFRVRVDFEFQDLIQEAYICFMRCHKKYIQEESSVTEPKHFMSLYQCTLINHFNDLSRKIYQRSHAEVDFFDFHTNGITDFNLGPLSIVFQQSPSEIKQMLKKFLDGDKIKDLHRNNFRERKNKNSQCRRRETTNQMLCEFMGLDHTKINLHQMFYDYFG